MQKAEDLQVGSLHILNKRVILSLLKGHLPVLGTSLIATLGERLQEVQRRQLMGHPSPVPSRSYGRMAEGHCLCTHHTASLPSPGLLSSYSQPLHLRSLMLYWNKAGQSCHLFVFNSCIEMSLMYHEIPLC